jgi:hypothetical protein
MHQINRKHDGSDFNEIAQCNKIPAMQSLNESLQFDGKSPIK